MIQIVVSKYVGLVFLKDKIKSVVLKKRKGSIEVVNYSEDTSKELIKEGVVSVSLNAKDSLVRIYKVESKKKKFIKSILKFELDPILNYSQKEAVVEFYKINSSKDKDIDIVAFAAKKEVVKNCIEDWKNAILEPEIITSFTEALAVLTKYLFNDINESIVVLYINQSEATCVLVKEGCVIASFCLNIKESIQLQIQRIILSWNIKYKNFQPSYLLILNEDGSEEKIKEDLINLTILNLPEMVFGLSKTEFLKYCYVIGVALAGSDHKIDFRKKENEYAYPFKKYFKQIVSFFSVYLMLTAAICVTQGVVNYKYKKSLLADFKKITLEANKDTNEMTTVSSSAEWLKVVKEAEAHISKQVNIANIGIKRVSIGEIFQWIDSVSKAILAENNFDFLYLDSFKLDSKKYEYIEIAFRGSSEVLIGKLLPYTKELSKFTNGKVNVEITGCNAVISFFMKDNLVRS